MKSLMKQIKLYCVQISSKHVIEENVGGCYLGSKESFLIRERYRASYWNTELSFLAGLIDWKEMRNNIVIK